MYEKKNIASGGEPINHVIDFKYDGICCNMQATSESAFWKLELLWRSPQLCLNYSTPQCDDDTGWSPG